MKKFIILVLALIGTNMAWAQDEEEMAVSADRPGMATGVGIQPQWKVNLEVGPEFGLGDSHDISLPNALVRVGVLSFAELRLQYNATLAEKDKASGNDHWKYNNDQPLSLGTKVRLFKGKGGIPAFSLLANMYIPCTKEQKDNGQKVAAQVYLLGHSDVTNWLSLDYNVGEEWYGCGDNPATFIALCCGFNISDRFGAFAESYNYIQKVNKKAEFSPNVDFGFTYTPCKRLQLDLYSGFTCKRPKTAPFIGCGLAWLIN